MTASEERLIEMETATSPAARAAVIARAISDEPHRSIAFQASYLALSGGKRGNVGPVIAELIECRYAPHIAPRHLRRLAAAVHIACEIASGDRPNMASLSTAGLAGAAREWLKIANRL
jgi:hypothetical protein